MRRIAKDNPLAGARLADRVFALVDRLAAGSMAQSIGSTTDCWYEVGWFRRYEFITSAGPKS